MLSNIKTLKGYSSAIINFYNCVITIIKFLLSVNYMKICKFNPYL